MKGKPHDDVVPFNSDGLLSMDDADTTRIVGLTAADGPDAYLAMLRAGASGLLVKGGSAERLVEMIHRAHEHST